MNELQALLFFALLSATGVFVALVGASITLAAHSRPWFAALSAAFAFKTALLGAQAWVSFHGREDWVSYLEFALAGLVAWLMVVAAQSFNARYTLSAGTIFLAAASAGVSGAWFYGGVPFIVACLPSFLFYLLAHLWLGWRLLTRARSRAYLHLSRWGWSLWLYAAWTGVMLPNLLNSRWYWWGYMGEAALHVLGGVWLVAALLSEGVARAVEQPVRSPHERLLAVLAQEMRTPLAAIKTAGYVVGSSARPRLNGEETEMLGMVTQRADFLTRLLADVQDYTRLLAGELNCQLHTENLVLAVRQVCGQEHASLQRRHVTLDISLPVTPLMVSMDRARLQRALETLLAFAGRATPNMGTLRIRLNSVGELAQLEIADSGPGIPPEALELLNKPNDFIEVDGLRLADQVALRVVRHVIEHGHGGMVAVYSELGAGTRFVVSVPLAVSAPVEFPPAAETEAAATERVSGPWEDVLERQKPHNPETRI